MRETGRPVIAEARIRPLLPSDFAPVSAVVDEWWGGRSMARMLPRLFFDHMVAALMSYENCMSEATTQYRRRGEAAAMAWRQHLLDDS